MKRLDNNGQPTIREVAERAGVSVATASYALNQNGRVAGETRSKVLQAAADLGYSPSIAARALKGGKGNLVAILTDGFAGPWYGEMLEGMQPAFNRAGYAVMALTLQKESLELCRTLAQSGLIRGFVMLNPGQIPPAAWTALVNLAPTAVFDPGERYDKALRFVLDNRGGMTSLLTHLWNRGYRDYLWLEGEENAWDSRERGEVFDAFLRGRELPADKVAHARGGFRRETAHRAVHDFIAKGRVPRVIVAANDESAVGALKAVRELNFRVPEDIAIAGFDGLDISAWTEPALTTLRYDRRNLGEEMAGRLMAAIDEGSVDRPVVSIPVELVVRAST